MKRILPFVLLICAPAALAHVGTSDVYFDGFAGPYHLLVTVRTPAVVPGVADIQIRVLTPGINEMRIVPTRIVGQGSDIAPVPDIAQRSSIDPELYTGKLWIMLRGSWKVRIDVTGDRGPAQLSVPIAAVSQFPLPMQRYLGVLLGALGLLLVVGLVAIVGASMREARLEPGQTADDRSKRRARVGMACTTAFVVTVLWLGNAWWNAEAAQNRQSVYRTPQVTASLDGSTLRLHLENPNGRNWSEPLRMTDFVPDHGHLMHLFLVRMPQMDAFAHLHPAHIELGDFSQDLPSMPNGHYKIYADVVHGTGFPETYVGEVDLPSITARSVAGDDSVLPAAHVGGNTCDLSDGYRMTWQRPAVLKANELVWLRFQVTNAQGAPAADLEPYMGMAGHAALISSDGSVFAHVHPSGSVPMVSAELAQGHVPSPEMDAMGAMPAMSHNEPVNPEVSFPWGFPRAGEYRLFVQVRRAGRVYTGVFQAEVK